MSKKISIPNNEEKNVELNIKVENNNIFKCSYIKRKRFEKESDIKMQTFFKVSEKDVVKEIKNENYAIYFLISDEDNKIYIGKSQNFAYRITRHYKEKEFSKILLLSSSEWTPTIIAYLEYWFIDFFANNKTFKSMNNKLEKEPKYTDADEEYIEYALDALKWLLLTEGINIDNSKNEIEESSKLKGDTKTIVVKEKISNAENDSRSFEQLYLALDEDTKELIDYVVKKISNIKNNIFYEKLLRYGSFKIEKEKDVKQSFVSIVLRKKMIKLYLHLKSYDYKYKENNLLIDVKNKGHWGTGNVLINIENKNDFDNIFEFIVESYNENC